MKIKASSSFKNVSEDHAWFNSWVAQLEKANGRSYERIEVTTSLGKTHVWGLNTEKKDLPALVIFPGARTSTLFWDFDRGLDKISGVRIYLVETNGLPNLSDGDTPDIKSLDYGYWAQEVIEELGLENPFVAGASFGGLIIMKLAIVAPHLVKAAFLLNPGCLQPFSMSLKNLYYNILPIVSPSSKNVLKFLDKAVFCKPVHQLSPESEKLIVEYEVFALQRYADKTQKPYYMAAQLAEVKADTYLLEGDKDLLFPANVSVRNAKNLLQNLKEVVVYENVAHGIETYDKAMTYISDKIAELA